MKKGFAGLTLVVIAVAIISSAPSGGKEEPLKDGTVTEEPVKDATVTDPAVTDETAILRRSGRAFAAVAKKT